MRTLGAVLDLNRDAHRRHIHNFTGIGRGSVLFDLLSPRFPLLPGPRSLVPAHLRPIRFELQIHDTAVAGLPHLPLAEQSRRRAIRSEGGIAAIVIGTTGAMADVTPLGHSICKHAGCQGKCSVSGDFLIWLADGQKLF
jgi:hypothetical protein